MGNVVETCLTMTEKENGQATKFNENQRESMLALKEKVATLLYVGDRPPRPLLHKARHITICNSRSSLQCSGFNHGSSEWRRLDLGIYQQACVMGKAASRQV